MIWKKTPSDKSLNNPSQKKIYKNYKKMVNNDDKWRLY